MRDFLRLFCYTRRMKTQSKLLKWSLILGIVIVANLFINYSISLFYSEPQYTDFCKQQQIVVNLASQADCVTAGGQWIDTTTPPAGVTIDTPTNMPNIPAGKISGYCNQDYTCSDDFTTAISVFERSVFSTLVSVGVVLIIAGFMLKTNSVVATSLALSGVLSLIIASLRYWSSAESWVKVLLLGIALAALIALAMRKFKNENLRP